MAHLITDDDIEFSACCETQSKWGDTCLCSCHDAYGMPLYAESTHATREAAEEAAEDVATQLRSDLQHTFTVVRKTLG